MNFSESESYLFSLGNEVSAMKLGLENIRRLLIALGNPQNNYLKVQVAGTNGKGSVCAFLDAICVSAGIKTGLYTSPHLVSITERIKIGGRDINEDNFARHATLVRETTEKMLVKGVLENVPTFFEQVTAIALTAFAEAKVELAILETGLGGRLDATTAANAEIAAITPIDIDHQEYLGETLAEIAAEKAAIIRTDSKVVIGEQPKEAMEVLTTICANFGVSPKLAREVILIPTGGNTTGRECVPVTEVGVRKERRNPKSKIQNPEAHFLPVVFPPDALMTFETNQTRYENVCLGLLGKHQVENAKVAILLAETLKEHFEITAENIIDGLQTAVHSGRLEFSGNFLFDGAHNVAGAKALKEFLDEFIDRPITMIFGSMRDKDISQIAAILFPKADTLILTKPDNSRAMTTVEIAGFVPSEFNKDSVILTESVEDALRRAAGGELILVTGSLYLVGDVKKILNN